ncbi:hypothetical protein N7471_007730 [Penicillium samsonianum]|uniref:uncharacterized protein n=1 Tax=Penicillium samsonianum TaxID=1882272 RepID=UPI0025493061|nr:uncharacterized protein N7471_007730 [Penicillium samsonianum]KAJ6132515.1 hypothetical protein N7471_007730 [Penicillium samsonianum]
MSHRPPGDLTVPDINTQEVCMQLQIRYACGHSTGGEFIKCPRHMKKEDERCVGRQIKHIDVKNSPHKCRLCLRSE